LPFKLQAAGLVTLALAPIALILSGMVVSFFGSRFIGYACIAAGLALKWGLWLSARRSENRPDTSP
jgi:hypothetical protein